MGGFAGRPDITARCLDLARRDKLGQALLFLGPEGSGKELTALEIARLLNCATPESCRETPSCESCLKAISYQHPDIRWIGPAPASVTDAEVVRLHEAKQDDPFHQPAWAASSEVLIGDPDHPGPLTVRSLLHFLKLKPFQGTTKVVVVSDAHRLRAGAANAFLKALEEPPPSALIILTTSMRTGVLPTIQSRCQRVTFTPYQDQELVRLLSHLYELPGKEAEELSRLGAGNARRAARLRLPLPRAVRLWADELADAISAGRAGTAMLAAEQLHKGTVPTSIVDKVGQKIPAAKELVARRERAILLCESLVVHYSEILRCLTRGGEWLPVTREREQVLREAAAKRTPQGILCDLDAIEKAQRDIERNLNIGLMMAVLFQELVRHVEEDRPRRVA